MARPRAWPGRPHPQQPRAPSGTLAYACLAAFLIALAGVLVAAAAPVLAGFRPLIINGGSMGESLPNGSLVLARWVPAGDVRPGDVVLVQEDGPHGPSQPKIHRIISLETSGGQVLARTRGDANAAADPRQFVLPARVLSPAYDIPYAGFFLAFIKTAQGWLLFVAIPGTVLCLSALHEIWFPGRHEAGPDRLRKR